MTIIYFFGPDGSGKTSLATKLVDNLSEKGIKVKYSWMRGSHTLASIISRALSKTQRFRGGDNPYYAIRIPKKLVKVWQILECISVIPVILSRYILPKSLGYTIIADRYSLDFIVWVALVTKDETYIKRFISRCAVHLAEKCDFLIFVTADPDELVKRSGLDKKFIVDQIQFYQIIIKDNSLKVHVIETTESNVDESMNAIVDTIKEVWT
ncbi:MAG: thymidylate kinase [Candidatus Hodarchaeota archaeon]